MYKSILGLSAAAALLATAAPALAQDAAGASPITFSGSVSLVSDYRFRGFSQSNQNAAIQGGITATSSSGVYVGTWGSSISFAGNTEVDLFAGYSKDIMPGLNLDVGVLYYLYPKHDSVSPGATDFFEPYATVKGSIGPATLGVGVNYAWKQSALLDNDGFKVSSVYIHAEPSISIPHTPFSLDGHLGYAKSDAFPGGVDGTVFDWSLGGSVAYKMLSFGVHYVDTDEPSVIRGSDAAVVFSLGASF